jgi:dipeptidyl aminopeptidase/acylaminoacyl peptidase
VVELRRANDGTLVTELARADDTALRQQGWQCPERFVAKGRDGQTDIYGVIVRPSKFDPTKKYPVLESIYAGPHDFFVPKAFFTSSNKTAMAELGFIVVSIDGMGTNWRNKKFHDVCWKNLSDSGFPDRVAWIKAAAATRPEFDLTRVGLFGGSAGGQSTLAGLLHHGDFYKAGVADCGCHDNRMDKIWWNEAWMGWPVDESYARNSNVTHAAKLTGKLLLVVGELDHNVDPASTAQVVAALEKAGKDFEFLPIMNSDHGAAESPYGKYRRAQFLIRNLR